MTWKMVFDVESVGLHGDGFAVGFVVVDPSGVEQHKAEAFCSSGFARGSADDRAWVRANVTTGGQDLDTPLDVRNFFWESWRFYKDAYPDLQLWTDCGWPVEANFLSACVADDPVNRTWDGPYPLFDVSTLLLTAGENPVGTFGREPNEKPAHNALNDARQSARVLRMFQPIGMTLDSDRKQT